MRLGRVRERGRRFARPPPSTLLLGRARPGRHTQPRPRNAVPRRAPDRHAQRLQ